MPKQIAPKGSSEAFLRKHVKYEGNGCLVWPYRLKPSGYGLAVIGGAQKNASRWMCILAHGNPPHIDSHAAHKCGNPSCVNPLHIRWATPKENMQDKVGHGTINRGERNGKTSLTASDVRYIRNAPPDLAALSEKFGMNKHSISKIRARKRWGHVL